MIRDHRGTAEFWNQWIEFVDANIQKKLVRIEQPSGNPRYRPQYIYEISNSCYEQILRRYSSGDEIANLGDNFELLISMWEKAEEIGKDVWTPDMQVRRHSWHKNLDRYICSFWLVGLALALEIPDSLWDRLLELIGNEGEDELLDRVIAVRQPNRRIGASLCHPKPYGRLLAAINANTREESAILLREFVAHWYPELDRPHQQGLGRATAIYEQPYWYTYGDTNFEGGAYFGRWCVEAVAAVKAFGLDDSLCLGHPAYPGDLLRPDGPTTHVEVASAAIPESVPDAASPKSWLKRFFGN